MAMRATRLIVTAALLQVGCASLAMRPPPRGRSGRRADRAPRSWAEDDAELRSADQRRRRRAEWRGGAPERESGDEWGREPRGRGIRRRVDDRSAREWDDRDDSPRERRAPPAPPSPSWSSKAGSGRTKKGKGFFSGRSFSELGASPDLVSALRAAGAKHPSHIQSLAFSRLIEGGDAIVADQTGSGKTLAYLGPIAQTLREIEAEEGRAQPGEVRALVLLPTAELAQQVPPRADCRPTESYHVRACAPPTYWLSLTCHRCSAWRNLSRRAASPSAPPS